MKHTFCIHAWIKPVITVILGAFLILNPGSLTSAAAWCIGLLIALVGAAKLVRFMKEMHVKPDIWGLAGAVILVLLGIHLMRNPAVLEKQLSRITGILLIMQAVRGYLDPTAAHEQVSSTLMCIAGAVLVLLPTVVPRLVVVMCGVVILCIGIGMIADQLHSKPNCSGRIIDSE